MTALTTWRDLTLTLLFGAAVASALLLGAVW